MRSARLLATVAMLGLAGTGVAGCSQAVSGHGTPAGGATRPTTSPPPAPRSPAPTPTPKPTVDPTVSKERVTCALVQVTIRSTNDKFNKAGSRAQQITILQGGATGVEGELHNSQLAATDRVFTGAAAVESELLKLISSAKAGGNPPTTPYNDATKRFSNVCATL